MVQKRVIQFALLFLIVLMIAPSLALAATPDGDLPGQIVPCNGADCNVCDLATLANNILNTAIYIAVFLSAVLFAWAGWLYLTSGGSGELSRAKGIFTNVAIGLVIVLIGWLVVDTLMRTLTGAEYGPWNDICPYRVEPTTGRLIGPV
ncbi:hypothetical protein COU18_03360 [Candidatus Kaiserbacteria bacterium CG10_big_fil_rev_8_21_14_0_10_51_14]|uniref:Vitamin K epoxide reductase domain-containing protein n=1 Tax=Candidatus Kaiserbacteria bacterium CG10_big_fil_rev_8_21_14_0_10_51_14 TaxID=1974610 RepID=A0A2H0UBH6_9BACT|nr:MAG: hypothetical protein COU18_03360 [Candidatus Kaiserbacteria bacterium CG10_big_fil_rev_8_21_14_0_10_51_14]